MLPQGSLRFRSEAERSNHVLTALAGLAQAIRGEIKVAGHQGWLDVQLVLALLFLNSPAATALHTLNGWNTIAASRRS